MNWFNYQLKSDNGNNEQLKSDLIGHMITPQIENKKRGYEYSHDNFHDRMNVDKS